MQAPPPFHLVVRHFSVWRGGLASLACAVIATVGAWALAGHQHEAVFPPAAFASLAAIVSVASIISLMRIRAFSLRWDGQSWWLRDVSRFGNEPAGGHLDVTVDLGNWMLIRFTPVGARTGSVRWLPVQRSGHTGSWHALRSTVHMSTRPQSLHHLGATDASRSALLD